MRLDETRIHAGGAATGNVRNALPTIGSNWPCRAIDALITERHFEVRSGITSQGRSTSCDSMASLNGQFKRETDNAIAIIRVSPGFGGRTPEFPQLQYTPTVVVAAISWNGRTPLMPSHGNLSNGCSRSPSSRSGNRGMKNSLVSVVSRARPVLPYSTVLV